MVRSLPPPFEFTPASRRRQEPLEISTSMGEVRLEGRWQVGRLTKISTGMGSVIIDLTEAEFDDWDVEIIVRVHTGQITVIAIDEPWPGYNELNAQEIIDRLTTADEAQLAVAELYEPPINGARWCFWPWKAS